MTKQFHLFESGDGGALLEIRDQKLSNRREGAAARAFARKLFVKARKTEIPVIIAMIGLPGSGKSSVAREFAEHIGGTILEYDKICPELHSRGANYESANDILRIVAFGVIHRDGNPVIDSDFIEAGDREKLRVMCRRLDVRLVFVRTYAGLDVVVKRLMPIDFLSGDYTNVVPLRKQAEIGHEDIFVKLWKLVYNLPKHYRIHSEYRHRRFVIKKAPRNLLADIDTTNFNKWRREVEVCARQFMK